MIACSDGRLQENIDDFLANHLGLTFYDRLYAPGGPGALATGGFEFLRSDQFRRECAFLIAAHRVETVILLFHGPSPDGPDEATCADYRRKLPRLSSDEIRDLHECDAAELLRAAFDDGERRVAVRVFRAEVTADAHVRFVDLSPRQS